MPGRRAYLLLSVGSKCSSQNYFGLYDFAGRPQNRGPWRGEMKKQQLTIGRLGNKQVVGRL
jgi:hypothetical protein